MRAWLVIISLLLSSPASAAIISPSVRLLRGLAAHPPRWLPPGRVTPEGIQVSLRFERLPDDAERRALEGLGVRLARTADGRLVRVGPILAGRVRPEAVELLQTLPGLVQVDALPLHPRLTPLDLTRPLTGAPALDDRAALSGSDALGQGIRIGDIDSGIDVFHPALFRADGGMYGWLDVDGDGVLTPGTDAVDLDGDGTAAPEEVLRLLKARVALPTGQGSTPSAGYEPDIDWLWVDTDSDGRRGHGAPDGFSDTDPAFGEPLFVLDDVNHNGRADPAEKLLRLGSSKVAAARVGDAEYVRGQNLATLLPDSYGMEASGRPNASHGTGVAGILVAGVPGRSRFVGIAPEADLYAMSYGSKESGGDVAVLQWAREHGVQVLLHEYSSWGSEAMDGSGNLEHAMDDMFWTDDVVQITPAGNLGGSGKHASVTLATGADGELVLRVPATWPGMPQHPFATPAAILSLYWPGGFTAVKDVLLVSPEGAVVVTGTPGIQTVGDTTTTAQCESGLSAKGFAQRMCVVYAEEGSALGAGDWTIRLQSASSAPVTVHAYTQDWVSGWSRAVHFATGESDASTLCVPATASFATAVGAYGGRWEYGGPLLALRGYSSRGPRLDGERGIDILAPDDPFVPLPEMADGGPYGLPGPLVAAWAPFGGTSGAGPHVAGAAALLRQRHPTVSAAVLEQRLLGGAVADAAMGEVPNPEWGYGRLDVFRAETGEPASANPPPHAEVTVASHAHLATTLDARASSAPSGAPLEMRWDLDYDGVWDLDWSQDPQAVVTASIPSHGVAKVEVRSTTGARAQALVAYEIRDVPDPEPDAGPSKDTSVPRQADEGGPATPDADTAPSDTAVQATPPSGPAAVTAAGGCGAPGPGPGPRGMAGTILAVLAIAATRRRRPGRTP